MNMTKYYHTVNYILKTFIILSTVITSATVYAGQPIIQWLEKNIDFGVFSEDQGVTMRTFHGINVGDEPLKILKVMTSCGCTTASSDDKVIMPGDTVDITVGYDPAGRIGRFKKRVSVFANTVPDRYNLTISGVVIGSQGTVSRQFPIEFGALRLRRQAMNLSDIYKGQLKSTFIETYNASPDTLFSKTVSLLPYLKVKMEPALLPPGQQGAFVIFYDTLKHPGFGPVTDTLEIIPDIRFPEAIYKLAVTANIHEDFSRIPDKVKADAGVCHIPTPLIDLGIISRDNKAVKSVLKIENRGKSALEIRRIYCDNPAVSFGKIPARIKKGAKSDIIVTVNPALIKDDILKDHITVITSDPFTPEIDIAIRGEVKD